MSTLTRTDAHAQALAFLLGRIDHERIPPRPYGDRVYKLDRMWELLARLGHPEQGLAIVHVAGTKGKGSTSAMLAAVLTAAGRRTGLFTSPHLERMEERIAVDGVPIAPEELVELVDLVRPAVAAMDAAGSPGPPEGPTYFDLTTALALLHFARRGATAAVLEVGMGGRLDSTNVCTPRVSVITSISLDHTRQLGDTPGEIAREKAGIIKPGVPVVSGVTEDEPRAAIRQRAAEVGARLIERGVDFDVDYRPALAADLAPAWPSLDFFLPAAATAPVLADLRLGLLGRHQAHNAAVALATLDELGRGGWTIEEGAIRGALAGLRWPARVEVVARRPAVVVDAAHNVASAVALAQTLAESFVSRPRTLVFATTREKDVAGMLRALLPRFQRVILTRYTTNPRYVPVAELADLARPLATGPLILADDPAAAWALVRATTTAEELVCVAGSFYLAAEMRALALSDPFPAAAPA